MVNFRQISQEELDIVNKIFSSKDLWHKSTELFLQDLTITGINGAFGVAGGGIGAGMVL